MRSLVYKWAFSTRMHDPPLIAGSKRLAKTVDENAIKGMKASFCAVQHASPTSWRRRDSTRQRDDCRDLVQTGLTGGCLEGPLTLVLSGRFIVRGFSARVSVLEMTVCVSEFGDRERPASALSRSLGRMGHCRRARRSAVHAVWMGEVRLLSEARLASRG